MSKSKLSSLVLPLVVVTTLLNIPGMAGEGMHARLVFMAVGVLAWVAAEIYDRRSDSIVGTVLDTACYAIGVFVSEAMRRTRVCISVTSSVCSIYAISVGGYWDAPPFLLAPFFIITTIWGCIELFLITLGAIEDWQVKRQDDIESQSYEERGW